MEVRGRATRLREVPIRRVCAHDRDWICGTSQADGSPRLMNHHPDTFVPTLAWYTRPCHLRRTTDSDYIPRGKPQRSRTSSNPQLHEPDEAAHPPEAGRCRGRRRGVEGSTMGVNRRSFCPVARSFKPECERATTPPVSYWVRSFMYAISNLKYMKLL